LTSDLSEFSRALTKKMMTYALGRGLERYDGRTVRGITGRLEASGYRFQTLVHEIVNSLPFQNRRGEVVKTAGISQKQERAQR